MATLWNQEPTSREDVRERVLLTLSALDLSQAELCRRTGITTQGLNNALTGDNDLQVGDAIAICQITGATLDWIYRGIRTLLPAAIIEKIAEGPPKTERKRA